MAGPQQYPEIMDCSHVHDALRAGDDLSGSAIGDHVGSCAPCSELVADGGELARALGGLDETPVDLSMLSGVLSAQLQMERGLRGMARRLPSVARLGVVFALVLLVVAWVGLQMARPDLGVYPVGRMALVLASLSAMLVGASVYATRPLHRAPLPRGLHAAALLSVVALPLALAVLPVAHSDHPMAFRPEPFWPQTLMCFSFGSVVAGLTVLSLWMVERRDRLPARVIVLFVGVGGLAGNLALQLQCPVTDPLHLVLGHGLVGGVWTALVGALWTNR